jgi:CheY-like chemotaxis protein
VSGQYLLLVDRNPVTRKGTTDKLSPAGYRTVTISATTDAVSALRQVRPAAVLIDIDAQDPAGSDLVELARQQRIPVIVTGDLPEGLHWAREHGAAFVAHPVSARTLQSVVERAISTQPEPPTSMLQPS